MMFSVIFHINFLFTKAYPFYLLIFYIFREILFNYSPYSVVFFFTRLLYLSDKRLPI